MLINSGGCGTSLPLRSVALKLHMQQHKPAPCTFLSVKTAHQRRLRRDKRRFVGKLKGPRKYDDAARVSWLVCEFVIYIINGMNDVSWTSSGFISFSPAMLLLASGQSAFFAAMCCLGHVELGAGAASKTERIHTHTHENTGCVDAAIGCRRRTATALFCLS